MAVMMMAMGLPAFAAVPTSGSITVNSPIVGATYTAYKVFDMTTNEDVNSFSYSISSNSPFFNTVKTYANMPEKLPDADADGLTLTVTADTAGKTPEVYNVSVTANFDPQAFGQALLAALKGTPAVADDPETEEDESKPAVPGISATAAKDPIEVTVANSESIKFEGLDLGYFLITSEYPKADFSTVTMTVKDYDGTASTDPDDKYEFSKADLVDLEATPLALTADAKAKIAEYVGKVVDNDYVEAYIADKGLKDKDADGNEIAITNPSDRFTEVKNELIESMEKDAEEKILAALANQLEGAESDINLAKEPILVFLDSSQPEAVINEKNEIDKWDTPVNPSGDALPEDLPDYGEPKGGKNIVISEDPVVYADWTEANIGDSIHYQLRVNAMNFVREGDGSDPATQATADKVQQVKEYFLADYQNEHMTFDSSKKLIVTVIDGNGNNVTKDKNGNSVTSLDYTSKSSTFFKNGVAGSSTTDVLGTSGGIMVPWTMVSEKNAELNASFPVYTTSTVNSGEQDEDGNDIMDTYYVYSLYNSDVTIVVDYYMTLNDDAVIDGDGNPNYAQYGYTPVEPKNEQPTPPSDDDKPSQKKEVDDATVYTFALAFVKIDKAGEALEGAKFELPFYVKKDPASDGAYVYAGTEAGTDLVKELTSPTDGVITIKGVEQGTYSFTETEAPDGYNKLAEPFEVEAKKTGEETITTTTKTIYLDANGNVTDQTSATTTVTTHTSDSNLPVYQFMPIVNKQGAELPSTGGIGTTIFYILGSLLVLGAVVVMVARRRVGSR